MGTYSPLAADVKATGRLLSRLIQAALDEQEELARRALLKGGAHFNRAFLAGVRHGLRELAEERGIEIVAGKYGKRLEAALVKGAQSVPGASYGSIGRDLLNMALANSEVLVQDILDDGVKIINGEMAKVIVQGKSVADVADTIREKVTLVDGGEIGAARAELIANSEIHSVYRQGQLAAGEAMGFEWYEYTGPDDDRTEPICETYLELGVMKLGDWQAQAEKDGIDFEIFQMYGAHYGCRHTLKPVPAPEAAQ